MLQKVLGEDEIIRHLLSRTNLTESQLDTLLINKECSELSLDKKRVLRDCGEVSKGSFVRTLKQAEKNLERSVYTIITLEYLSLLDKNSILNLIKIGGLLKEVKTQKVNYMKMSAVLTMVSRTIREVSRLNTRK